MPSNQYMKDYMAKRRIDRRAKLLEMAGGRCSVCGETEKLEFNHIDRETKLFQLSGKGLDKSWEKILEEYSKCNLLCKKHHEEYTKQQYDSKEITAWNKDLHGEYLHGSPRSYHAGCRCLRCKKAKKIYRSGLCHNHSVVA